MYKGAFHNYQILINPVEGELYPPNYVSYLYNTNVHLAQQPCNEQVSFYLVNFKKQVTEAAFHIFIEDKTGISPCKAPFGGIEFAPHLNLEVLQFFWENIEAFLQTQHLNTLKIKAYPACYQPENAQVLQYLLLQNGFNIAEHNLNQHLVIDDQPLKAKMHDSEKRRLQKCYQQGYQFEIWLEPDFDFVLRFVQNCRDRKGYPTSLSADALSQLFKRFTHHFTQFVLRDPKADSQNIIALATGVKVHDKILYYFLPADDEAYLADSPMVHLIDGIYQYCQTHGFKMLDLGISTEFSQPNYGLLNFKKNMGANTSLKLTFIKKF